MAFSALISGLLFHALAGLHVQDGQIKEQSRRRQKKQIEHDALPLCLQRYAPL